MSRITRKLDKDQKRRNAGGHWVRYFSLQDKESATVVILGREFEEPHMPEVHSVRFSEGKFDKIVCRGTDCVACHEMTAGKKVSRPTTKGFWTVYDLRWQKRIPDPERSTKDEQRYKYKFVPEAVVNKKGIAKGKFLRAGKCAMELSERALRTLDSVSDRAATKCRSCLKGKISLLGYKAGKSKVKSSVVEAMKDDEIEDKLKEGEWEEILRCSKCEKPCRTTVFNSCLTVTRQGTGQKTTYVFTIDPTETVPKDVRLLLKLSEDDEDYAKVRPFDWDKVKGAFPMKPSQQAAVLGCENPYEDEEDEDEDDDSSDSYDDDDDLDDNDEDDDDDGSDDDDLDSDDDDDADDDEDGEGTAASASYRGEDDDDDEEEDDEDEDEGDDAGDEDEDEDDDDEDDEDDEEEEPRRSKKSKKNKSKKPSLKTKKSKKRRKS